MKLKPFTYFTIVVLSTVLITLNACTKPFTDIQKIEVRNQGSFDYKDGLTFMANSKSEFDLFVLTNPESSNLFYSINNEAAQKLKDDWITVDSTTNFVDLYTSTQKPPDENYRLKISYGQDNLLESIVSFYPNPVADVIFLKVESQTRGIIKVSIFKVNGLEVYSISEFISEDVYEHQVDVSSWEYGVYFLKVEYGDRYAVYRIVKN